MDNLIKDDKGFIKTGEGTYVNPQYLSQSGLESARNFAVGQTPTISSDTLTPTRQVSLPTIPVSTGSAGLSGYVGAYNENLKTQNELEKKAQEAKSVVSTEQESLKDKIAKLVGIQSSVPELEKQAGLDVKAQAVTDITNKIEASNRAQQNELRALEGVGLTDVERGIKAREINRRYAFEQADLGLIQSARNRDYETASNILNRKIELQLEPLKTELNFSKMFYDENKDLLTKAEDRAFQNKIKEDDRKYNLEKEKQDTIKDITLKAIENGITIPSSVMSEMNNAKDTLGVTQALARSGISLAKPTGGGMTGMDTKQYKDDLDAIIGTALSTIPTKFGQQTFNSQILKARNDGDKLTIVAAQVLKGQPAEFKNDFRNQSTGIAQVEKAIAELDNGVKTGFINNASQYAYNIFGKDFDPKLAKINGYITSAIQPYRNSVTGAAWGEQEDTEYESLFGSTRYSPQELRQRLVQVKEMLKSKSAEGLNTFVNPIGIYQNPFNVGSLGGTGQTINVNGQKYVIGQIYQDGSGSKWTVDASGNWKKQ